MFSLSELLCFPVNTIILQHNPCNDDFISETGKIKEQIKIKRFPDRDRTRARLRTSICHLL